MARIRSVKPEFWTSEALATRLPGPEGRQARLLFIALWNHAEDHGVCRASPALLRSQAFPYDEDVTAGDVSRWLGLLEAGRFIVRYERNGSAYAWVRGFDEHQKIDRKSKTSLPEPSHADVDSVASPRRALDEPSLQEGKGREGKGEEAPTEKTASPTAAVAASPTFDDIPDATDDAQPVDERPALVLETQQAGKQPRKPSAGEALYFRMEDRRQKACVESGKPFIPAGWSNSRINRDLGPIARAEKGNPEAWRRFQGAWLEFITDEAPGNAADPWPLDWFWAQRAKYEARAAHAEEAA